MTSYDICIHGAGFVGQSLALRLAQAGFKVALLDLIAPKTNATVESKPTDIRAFALSASSKALLESIHAWPDTPSPHAASVITPVTPVRTMQIFGDAGGETQFKSSKQNEPLNWIVDVLALTLKLKEQISREPRITCLVNTSIMQTWPEAQLHVICEGRHSSLRDQLELELEIETIHYPQTAIAARLQCEHLHQETARQWFNDHGEILGLLPLGGEGSSEVALVWSLETEHAQSMMQASDAEFTDALASACGNALGWMKLTSLRAIWPLQMTHIKQWSGQKAGVMWVLAGDTAHAVHPLAGQGLNFGLGDVSELAQTLIELQNTSPSLNISEAQWLRALRQYARARQAAMAPIAWATDSLHLLFAHQHPAIQKARNLGMKIFNHLDLLKNRVIQRAQ